MKPLYTHPAKPVLLKFKRLPNGEDMPTPSYTSSGAAGMDLSAAESATVTQGKTSVVRTGFAVEVPEGYELQVRSRSGLAAKHGVFVTNGPGTIDSDYRGEIMVILSGSTPAIFNIERGDRIAQLVLAPVTKAVPVEVDELSSTDRGTSGLGSTGVR